MDNNLAVTVAVACAGALSSGFMAYVGVRIALAEVRKDTAHNKEDLEDLKGYMQEEFNKVFRRIDRLEEKYFK